jgi:hypothetical protein
MQGIPEYVCAGGYIIARKEKSSDSYAQDFAAYFVASQLPPPCILGKDLPASSGKTCLHPREVFPEDAGAFLAMRYKAQGFPSKRVISLQKRKVK